MQSDRFNKLAKEIVVRDSVTFDALMEFEDTKRIRAKTRLNFTIDRATAARFKRLCKTKGYNMSAKIESAIKDTLRKEQLAN